MLPGFIRPKSRDGCCMLTSCLVTPFSGVVSSYHLALDHGQLEIVAFDVGSIDSRHYLDTLAPGT